MARQRELDQKRGWAFTTAVALVKPTLLALTKREWHDGLKIPAEGGCVVAMNHLSHADPLTYGHFIYDHGRIVRYLAKQEVFEMPFVRTIAVNAGQIPVARLSGDASKSFDAAVEAVREGQLVAFYPEGTITRDPGLWPMTGKSGAARIALETGCPVIPVGQWGAQDLLAPYARKPDLFPRKQITMHVGEPVDLSDLLPLPRTPEVVQQATDRILDAVTELVAEIRQETPPAERFDARRAGVPRIGNPNKKERK